MTVLETRPERFWDLDRCCNFRDLGGYRTGTGSTIRWRTLFRSDSLARSSSADCARLRDLGLSAVVDLRSEHEIALGGRYPDEHVAYHHVPFGDLLGSETDWAAWSDPGYVADRYFQLCLESSDAVAEVLAILTDPSAYPAVIHCSLGKDRTGVLVALLLRAIGIPAREVAEDHALSRAGAERLVERLRAQMGEDHGDLDPYLPAMLAAEPETMRAFLRRVNDSFGSVRQYVAGLGIASSVDYLRAALLD